MAIPSELIAPKNELTIVTDAQPGMAKPVKIR
jgi:hypothetical protein